MPLKPCSFESFYAMHNVPNLAHMIQTVEFIVKNHSKINGLRTVIPPFPHGKKPHLHTGPAA